MTTDFRAARLNMVESQVRTSDVTDHGIQDAMRAVAREQFCPGKPHLAYADAEVEYAPGRYLLSPRDVAKLLQGLTPRPGERALAVAAPYAAAVLRHIGLAVEESDGEAAARPGAYDLVVSEGAVAEIPADWIAALASSGRLGAIQRQGPVGKATIVVRTEDGVASREMFDASPPFLPRHEPKPSFSF